MRAGRLRHRVVIQQLVAASPQQDAGGVPDETWTALATVWAQVSMERGRELQAAQQVNPEITGIIRMRYRSDVTEAMRISFNSMFFDILAVINPDFRNRELVLYVRSYRDTTVAPTPIASAYAIYAENGTDILYLEDGTTALETEAANS